MRRAPLLVGTLLGSLHWVLSHRTAAGIDGVSPSELRDDPAKNLDNSKKRLDECLRIYRLLKQGRYRFMRARRGTLRRKGKDDRHHAIATNRDATVLRGISSELREVWDQLPPEIVGHRPGTDYVAVLGAISRFIAEGPGWVLRFDLKGAFASASFERAIEILERRTDRKDLIPLIKEWRAAVGPKFEGLVEGSPISPLLLAVLLADHVVPNLKKAGGLFVIWGDDGLLMVRDRATVDAAFEQLVSDLDEIDLKVHPKKTDTHEVNPMNLVPTQWSFIGFAFRGWRAVPSAAALAALLDKLEALAVKDDVGGMKRLLMDWALYFEPGDAPDLYLHADREMLARCGFVTSRPPSILRASGNVALRTQWVRNGRKGPPPAVTWDSDELVWKRPLSHVVAPKADALSDSTTNPTCGAAQGAGGPGQSGLGSPAPSHSSEGVS